MRFMEILAGAIHLWKYNNLHSKDWNILLLKNAFLKDILKFAFVNTEGARVYVNSDAQTGEGLRWRGLLIQVHGQTKFCDKVSQNIKSFVSNVPR